MRPIDADKLLDYIDISIKAGKEIGINPVAALYLKKRIEGEPTIDLAECDCISRAELLKYLEDEEISAARMGFHGAAHCFWSFAKTVKEFPAAKR